MYTRQRNFKNFFPYPPPHGRRPPSRGCTFLARRRYRYIYDCRLQRPACPRPIHFAEAPTNPHAQWLVSPGRARPPTSTPARSNRTHRRVTVYARIYISHVLTHTRARARLLVYDRHILPCRARADFCRQRGNDDSNNNSRYVYIHTSVVVIE